MPHTSLSSNVGSFHAIQKVIDDLLSLYETSSMCSRPVMSEPRAIEVAETKPEKSKSKSKKRNAKQRSSKNFDEKSIEFEYWKKSEVPSEHEHFSFVDAFYLFKNQAL